MLLERRVTGDQNLVDTIAIAQRVLDIIDPTPITVLTLTPTQNVGMATIDQNLGFTKEKGQMPAFYMVN